MLASDIRPGDVVTLAKGTAVRVTSIAGHTAKQVTFVVTYVRCDGSPASVGWSRATTHRLTTDLPVERPHAITIATDGRHGYPYRARCGCGWTSNTYAAHHAAQAMADDHVANPAESVVDTLK